nr:MAG TPA: hypothetical protein [Caudoviricetes sp.]
MKLTSATGASLALSSLGTFTRLTFYAFRILTLRSMDSHCASLMKICNLHEHWTPKKKKVKPYLAVASFCQRQQLLRSPKRKKPRWKS